MTERTHVHEPEAPARSSGRRLGVSDPNAVEQAIDELWAAFTSLRTPALRDRLVLHYAPMVKYVASRVGTGLPQHVDAADLVQAGIFGLLDAIDRFEPERGWKFETFAMQRVRGAILDDLRAQDWVPRSVRSKARAVQGALARLEASLHRSPTDAEVAAEAELTLPELHLMYKEMSMTSVIALDDLVGGDGGLTAADVLADEFALDPEAALESQEAGRLLAEAVAGLPERDRTVVTLYYFENLTLAEIGAVLGVTESRICQLHTRAVLRLRTRIAEVTGERVPDAGLRPRARRGRG